MPSCFGDAAFGTSHLAWCFRRAARYLMLFFSFESSLLSWFLNPVIRLPSNPSLGNIEECLHGIRTAPHEDLWTPTNVTTGGLLGWALLNQAIITWARRSGRGALIVETDHASSANLVERVVHKPHGMIGALTAERVRSNAGIDQTLQFRAAAETELRRSQQPDQRSEGQSLLPGLETESSGIEARRRGGLSIELCADGHGALATPRSLYSVRDGTNSPRSSSEFSDWALREFNQSFKSGAMRSARADLPGLADIGRAVAELFSNTHKWGRTEINGAWIRRSVRGIVTDAVRDATARFKEDEPEPIRVFLDGLQGRFKSSAASGAMEISVFDSGPGLAQHWLGRAISDAEDLTAERSAVLHCLQKWGTKGGAESRGLGLHTVMANLSKADVGGLLLIRTGRLALFRDLHRNPLQTVGDAPVAVEEYKMSDLFHNKAAARVEGTLVSMIVPVPTR